MFAGTFAPVGWLMCDGQILSIASNDALFSLIGTTYGGDGQTTFALPDLRSRMPVHAGQTPRLGQMAIGQAGGSESVSLTTNQLAGHSHAVSACSQVGTQDSPANAAWANSGSTLNLFASGPATVTFAPAAITASGGGQPHDNMMPFTTVSFIIATEGIYPPSS